MYVKPIVGEGDPEFTFPDDCKAPTSIHKMNHMLC